MLMADSNCSSITNELKVKREKEREMGSKTILMLGVVGGYVTYNLWWATHSNLMLVVTSLKQSVVYFSAINNNVNIQNERSTT